MSKVAVVTGGSAGVGRATVRELAKAGYDVAILARGADGLDGARADVEGCARRALPIPTDVADYQAVEAAAERIERELGPIDVWVNDAFSNVFAEFSELTAQEYARITNVSYLGFVHGTMAALKRMRARDSGLIVQVGSALSYRSIPLQAAYCGAKAAIRGFTDSIRCELHHHRSKVRISLAILPAVNTPQFGWCRSKLARKPQPVPPIYQPEVIGRAIVWLTEHPRRELPIGWSVILALCAQQLAPGFADRYLGATGFDAQQYDGGRPPDAPDNLEHPVSGDAGAHGDFDDRSRTWSSQLWVAMHLRELGLAAAAVAGIAAGRALTRPRPSGS